MNDDLSNLNNTKNELIDQIINLESNISNITSSYPFKINRIEIANVNKNSSVIDEYGSTLYDYRIRYLMPKIFYTGYVSNKSVTINYKIFNPDGSLEYNTSYSTVYTGSGTDISIYNGDNEKALKGWGNATSSNYSMGNYRIEIWYNGICFGTKNFEIDW